MVEITNECRCSRRVGCAISHGRIDPGRLLFAHQAQASVRHVENSRDAAAVFHSQPEFKATERILEAILATGFSGDISSDAST